MSLDLKGTSQTTYFGSERPFQEGIYNFGNLFYCQVSDQFIKIHTAIFQWFTQRNICIDCEVSKFDLACKRLNSLNLLQ